MAKVVTPFSEVANTVGADIRCDTDINTGRVKVYRISSRKVMKGDEETDQEVETAEKIGEADGYETMDAAIAYAQSVE